MNISIRLVSTLLMATAVGCGGGDKSSPQNTTQAPENRIINGVAVDPASFPQIVRLNIFKAVPEGIGQSICTGTVIGKYGVLTAAHCLEGSLMAVGIESGVADVVAATGFSIHPLRNTSPLDPNFKDVAILLTGDYSTDSGTPIPLPVLGIDSLAMNIGEAFLISGYGLDENGEIGTLKAGQMVTSAVTTDRIFSIFDQFSDTCFGDSGGPAVRTRVDEAGIPLFSAIAGVVEAGTSPECAQGETASFTAVSEPTVIQFLRDTVPDAMIF